jgi:hypothetical protein
VDKQVGKQGRICAQELDFEEADFLSKKYPLRTQALSNTLCGR